MNKVKKLLKQLLGYIPCHLPIKGMKEFNEFSESILDTYGLPKEPSYYHTIATMVMHHDNTSIYVSKAAIARAIKKAMANQIAYAKIETIREEEKKSKASKDEASEALEKTV